MDTNNGTPLIFWGRVRTGRRWFWTAYEFGTENRLEGKTDTLDEANRQGHLAALQLAGGVYAHIAVSHGVASSRLRELNAAKRKTRPAPDTADAGPIEYLYFIYDGDWDGNGGQSEVWRYRITRKTRTRIYFARTMNPRDTDPFISCIDRQRIEADGEIWYHGRDLYLRPPQLPKRPASPDLKELKKLMADAHPDRGGSDAEFIEARARYQRARTRVATAR